MDDRPPSLWSHRGLVALAVGLPVGEAAVLLALRIDSGLSLAGQASALGPFGVFHDLRWLFVFHRSILAFVGGMVLLLVFRTVVTAALVRLAWPADRPAPPLRRLLWWAGLATAVGVAALWPWVTLLFGAAIVPLSWLFFAGFPPALITILLLHHAGVTPDWWRRLPALRSLGWAGVAFLGLTVGGLAAAGRPGWVALPVIAMTGAFNAWVWQRATAAVVHRRPLERRRLVPVTVIALVALFAVVVAGSSIGFAAFTEPDEVIPAPATTGDGPGIVLVPGYAAACCDDADGFHEAAAGFRVEQFSYLGVDGAGNPLPHGGDATDRDLVRLADLLHRQVAALAERAGSPVAVVAESEGTLIATAMLILHPDAPVDRLALLSPILEPGRAEFPERGEEGPGVVAGYQLRAVMEIIDQISELPLSADGPLSSSVRRWSDVLAEATVANRPGVEELAVVPLADSVTGRARAAYDIGVVVVAGFHGGLRSRADVQDLLLTWIRDGGVERSDVLAALDRLIAGSAAAWHVPSLEEYRAVPSGRGS
jgi:hypothetical protein